MNLPIINFAIRDDDTSYFTQSEQLESCYGKIWDICPVSLSVVPFHACTKSGAVPRKYWSGDQIFSLEDNRELVEFLRDSIARGRIYVTMHGYHHRDEPNGYEFAAGPDLGKKTIEGKAYLEKLLGQEIKVFVPPHNTLGVSGYRAVLKAGMHISGIQPFKPSFRGGKPRITAMGIKRRLTRKLSENVDLKPILFPDGHYEIPYCSLTPAVTLERLIQSFDRVRKRGGIFCLATHYWEFDNEMQDDSATMRQVFQQFWEYVMNFSDNVTFRRMNELIQV